MKACAETKKNKRGLTMIELIVVLAIVGIVGTLAATAIVSSTNQYTRIVQQETAKKAVTLLQQYVTSSVRYADKGTLGTQESGVTYTSLYMDVDAGQLMQKIGAAQATPLAADATIYGGLYYTAEWGAQGKTLTYTIRAFPNKNAATDVANAVYAANATVRLQNATNDINTDGASNPSPVFSYHVAP